MAIVHDNKYLRLSREFSVYTYHITLFMEYGVLIYRYLLVCIHGELMDVTDSASAGDTREVVRGGLAPSSHAKI